MYEYEDYLQEDFIIWNGELGVRDFVTIGEIDSANKKAWLDEPYEMVGPFCLDELCKAGKISFAACMVMSQHRWKQDRLLLQEESIKKQQKLQEELYKEINKNNRKKRQKSIFIEKEHRELLCLDPEGTLKVSQIKSAYKRIAKTTHPDVGGSHDEFIKITKAKDALLEIYELA